MRGFEAVAFQEHQSCTLNGLTSLFLSLVLVRGDDLYLRLHQCLECVVHVFWKALGP